MNIFIKNNITAWFKSHPSVKQWLWFIVLWLGGLITVLTITYPIKIFFRYL